MNAPRLRRRYLVGTVVALPLIGLSAAWAEDPGASAAASPLYQLAAPPLIASSRWADPLTVRLDTAAGLAGRHEFQFSAPYAAAYGTRDGGLLPLDATAVRIEPTRATYRYTFLQRDDWALKVGLTGNLNEPDYALRTGLSANDRAGFGALPMLHLAGEGRFAEHWRVSFAADGVMTARGRAFDIGLRVNYLLGSRFSLYGGYRLTESAGDAEDVYVPGVTNTADFGVRYRF